MVIYALYFFMWVHYDLLEKGSVITMAPRKKKTLSSRRELAEAIIKEYVPKSAEDVQLALKDIFGPIFESMLQGELDSHLGYENNDHSKKSTTNRRNGYNKKTIKDYYGRCAHKGSTR